MKTRYKIVILACSVFLLIGLWLTILLHVDPVEAIPLEDIQKMIEEQERCLIPTAYDDLEIEANQASLGYNGESLYIATTYDNHGPPPTVVVHLGDRTITGTRASLRYKPAPSNTWQLSIFDADGKTGTVTVCHLPLELTVKQRLQSLRWRFQHWMEKIRKK